MIVPRPVRFEARPGSFRLRPDTPLAAPPELEGAAALLREQIAPATGCRLPPGDGGITMEASESLGAEEYRLAVSPAEVRVTAGGPAGAVHATQTLRQLLPPDVFRRAPVRREWPIRCALVDDRPAYGWRGCMLDVARHFLPKADLLRYVDLLAMHKLNVLHLHLTDDQGWRLEIERYPRLTEVGAWRRESRTGWNPGRDGRPHGGYYTRDDIREIVAYASARAITVVPEIDIPGHSEAAIAAYPPLGNLHEPIEVGTGWGISKNVLNVSDETIEFFTNVFDEVFELFPGEVVHIGGDEVPKDQWKASPVARRRIRELGLRDEHELQSWFIGRFAEHFAARGRRLLGWDEILEGGLPPGAIVASWRGTAGAVAAARAGHDVINCPDAAVYLNYRQSDDPAEPIPVGTLIALAGVYAFSPVPPELDEGAAARVLGGQANIWTEALDSARAIDYQAFPRLCAFAEAMWSREPRDLGDFLGRLDRHLKRLDAVGVEYRPASGPLPWQTRPDATGHVRIDASVDVPTPNDLPDRAAEPRNLGQL